MVKSHSFSDKSYVSMEQHVCLVCGVPFDTGSLLLDKRLRASLERHTVTDWGLCPEHQKRFSEGFIALVECDPERSGISSGNTRLKPENAYRTGRIAHVKRHVFDSVFNTPVPADQAVIFTEPGVIDNLQLMANSATD